MIKNNYNERRSVALYSCEIRKKEKKMEAWGFDELEKVFMEIYYNNNNNRKKQKAGCFIFMALCV